MDWNQDQAKRHCKIRCNRIGCIQCVRVCCSDPTVDLNRREVALLEILDDVVLPEYPPACVRVCWNELGPSKGRVVNSPPYVIGIDRSID